MFFSQLEQLGAGWALWFAVIGLVAMAGLLYVPKMLQGNKSRLRQLMMGGKTLNSRLRSGFFLTAIVPLLTLVPVLVIIGSVAAQKMQIEQLDKRADVVAATLPRLLDKQILVFSGLAARLSQTAVSDSKDMLPVLAEFHESSPEFVSLWLATASGDVTVATKIAGEQAESWAGPAAGVSMMDSFAEALAAGGLYVSPAERGAGAAKEPMVFVSAPVSINKDGIKKDEPQLYIQGLLNLRSLFGLPSMNDAGSDVSLVVLDDKQRVLLSSPETLFESFADLSGHAMISGDADTAGSGFSQGVSRYIAAGQPLENGWQVYAVASQSGSYVVMLAYFTLAGLWAFLAAFVGFRLSPLYTQQVIEPLQKLDESLDVFDAERTISNIPNAPANAPQEIRQVFDRVRRSMRNSRDSYHSMLKAVNEGIQLREQLQKKSTPTKSVKAVAAESTIIVHEEPADTSEVGNKISAIEAEPEVTWTGRIDAVTALSGRDVFEGFFSEAWTFGASDSRPITMIVIGVLSTDDESLKRMADCMKDAGGRTLDFIARVGAWEFVMILPDTDLNGGLGVAQKMSMTIANTLPEQAAGVSFGVASIVPSEKGNAKAFMDMAKRSMLAAQEEAGVQVGYVNEEGKLALVVEDISNSEDDVASDKSDDDDDDRDNDVLDWTLTGLGA